MLFSMEPSTPPRFFLTQRLSATLGATDAALRLLLTILFTYFIAILYRYTLYGKRQLYQHVYFALWGIACCYFNYGVDVWHSALTVTVVYLLIVTLRGSAASVALVFLFTMSYLLLGYYFTETESYDIVWTMPQCVLTLRLIGLAFDVYDGHKNASFRSAEQKQAMLTKVPSILEVVAYAYFPLAFLVGPQFPLRRYQQFVAGEFGETKSGINPSTVWPASIKVMIGVVYMGMSQLGSMYFPTDYLLKPQFLEASFPMKLVLLGIYGKFLFYKYVTCWQFTEGACMIAGIAYNGRDKDGNELWDGLKNIDVLKFETLFTFDEVIRSFNLNTNKWVAAYIFKRMKFLGNKLISQGTALLFLAIWHGLHFGYYNTFLLELMVMKMEKESTSLLWSYPKVATFLSWYPVYLVSRIFLKLNVTIFLGYCTISFALLSFSKSMQVFSSLYFIGHIYYFGWPVIHFVLRKCVRSKASSTKED